MVFADSPWSLSKAPFSSLPCCCHSPSGLFHFRSDLFWNVKKIWCWLLVIWTFLVRNSVWAEEVAYQKKCLLQGGSSSRHLKDRHGSTCLQSQLPGRDGQSRQSVNFRFSDRTLFQNKAEQQRKTLNVNLWPPCCTRSPCIHRPRPPHTASDLSIPNGVLSAVCAP